MHRLFTKSIAFIALVGAFTLVPAAKSEAALRLFMCTTQLCQGGTTILVLDNAVAPDPVDTVPVTGAISWSGAFDGFFLSVNTTFGIPVIGSDANPQLDLSFLATSSGAAEGWIYADQFPDTSLEPDPGSYTFNFGGTTQGTIYAEGLVGYTNNALPNGGWQVAGPFGPGPWSGSMSFGPTPAPYAQGIGVHIIHTAAGTSSGDLHLIPEPATLALLGAGLAGLATRRRKAAR